jgi:hypothetical protein
MHLGMTHIVKKDEVGMKSLSKNKQLTWNKTGQFPVPKSPSFQANFTIATLVAGDKCYVVNTDTCEVISQWQKL